jgi:parvulin-like peptidyl-prolyl isomerase
LKKSIVIVFILIVSISILLFTGCDKTLARVDGIEIKQNEVDIYMNFIKSQSTDGELTISEEELKALQVNIIDSLIVIKLLEEYADKNGITVSSQEVDERLATVIDSYASEEDFEENLKNMGIDRDFLESELKSQILRRKIYDAVTTDIIITDQQAKQYYDDNKESLYLVPARVKASHILAAFPWIKDGSEESEEGREEALRKIETVEDKLKNGGDFEELAKQYSDDDMTAEDGGDLGYISKGQTVEEFEEALFSLDEGEVSGIIETEYGFHIIKILDRQEEYYQDFEEVEENIKVYLSDLHKLEEYNDFIFSLIEDADIEYFIDTEGTLEQSQEESE